MKRCLLSIILLSAASPAASWAGQAPGTSYVDGEPCNSFCQSYLAWSRRVLNSSMRHAMHRAMAWEPYGPAPRGADLGAAGARPFPGGRPATSAAPPERTRAQALAAATVAEQLAGTASAASELKAMNEKHFDAGARAADGRPGVSDDGETAVALVIVRPEIKSLAEIAGKNVAIDDRQAVSGNPLRIALLAAGAPQVHLSGGAARPIDRLLQGEVPAAVLTIAPPDIAAVFPDIAGFTLFKVPLGSPVAAGTRDTPKPAAR